MSDVIVLTQDLTNDSDKTLNFFNTCDIRRKNKFVLIYLSQFFKGQISTEKVLIFLRQLQLQDNSFQILLNQLYLCTQIIPSNTDQRKTLYSLLSALADRLPTQLKQQFYDYFDEETLWESGLLIQEQFLRKKRAINTNINYIQNKYGLMKEENEGFSKLIVEICDAGKGQMIDESTEDRIQNIVSLIGYFDLDPDRVIDIITEAWISNPFNLSYIVILKEFKQNSLSHFLGKRFEQLLSTRTQTMNFGVQVTRLNNICQAFQTDSRIPSINLIQTTALALKYNLFQLPHIWKYLSPTDEDMEKIYLEKQEDVYKYYKSFDQLRGVEELKDQENLGEKLKRELPDQYLYNQKLWLLYGLLSINDYEHFYQVYYIIGSMIDLTQFIPLKKVLAEFIEWMIQPLYSAISYTNIFKSRTKPQQQFHYDSSIPCRQMTPQTEFNQAFINNLKEIIIYFAPYIGETPLVFNKIMKIINHYCTERNNEIEKLVMAYLLPSITGSDNLSMVLEIWKFISQLHFRKRYYYYTLWKDDHQFLTIHQIMRASELTKVQLRSTFNKLDKDSKDKIMLKLAKISHNQPILVMNDLRRNRLEISDNNPFMVHALGLQSPLSADLLVFSFVQWLCDFEDESKIRDKDIECAFWFKNLGYFLAGYFRKYYHVEMQGLFLYICEGLASKQSIIKPELFILRELIEKMTGIMQIQDLNPQQIQALAGGRYIQLETTLQTNEFRKSRKSSQALEGFFWNTTINSCTILNQNQKEEEVSLAFLLFVLLCQQRTKFLLSYVNSNLKPLSALYDNFTWSINQLTKCLIFQTDKPTHYALLFPENPLHKLTIDYKITFEIAFHIVRYGHKSLYNMTDSEFQTTRDNIKNIFEQIDSTTMFQNPDIENFDRQQVKFIAHSYFKNSIWSSINPDLFAIFWLLSLDNIYVPVDVYENQLSQIQETLNKQSDSKEQARQQKSSSKAYEKLQNELETNKKRKEQFDNFLISKKDAFPSNQKFEHEKFDHEKFSLLLSQFCILPRILIDPAEAIYCAKFVHMFLRISKLKYTCTFYIPKEIIYYTVTFLQCATEQESVNLSIFIHQLVLPFANWNDEAKYKQDIKTYFDQTSDGYSKEKNYIIGNFYRIAQFIKLFKNNETQVRNVLIFLKRMYDMFPPTQQIADIIKEYVQSIDEIFQNVTDIKTKISTYRLTEKYSQLSNFIYTPPGQQSSGNREKKDGGRFSQFFFMFSLDKLKESKEFEKDKSKDRKDNESDKHKKEKKKSHDKHEKFTKNPNFTSGFKKQAKK